MQSKKPRALGKGLGALLPARAVPVSVADTPPSGSASIAAEGGATETYDGQTLRRLPLAAIKPNPFQPRLHFDESALSDLANSIRVHGVIQPIAVARRNGQTIVVAGERRLRAARLAGLETIPAIEIQLDDRNLLEYALIENLQRENLNPIEEAKAYEALVNTFSLSQEEVADQVGRSRPAIANSLRLLKLPVEIQGDLESGALSAGHARAILMLETAELQLQLRAELLKRSATVRDAEQMARRLASAKPAKQNSARQSLSLDTDTKHVQEQLIDRLACRVVMRPTGKNRGRIEIHYSSLDELQRFLEAVGIDGSD